MAQGGTLFGAFLFCALAVIGARSIAPSGDSARPEQAKAPIETEYSEPAQTREPVGNGFASFAIDRAPDNHFYADAQVNGTTVRFLVDTGATGVVLTATDAQRAGIGGGNFTAVGIGAGGEVQMMPATAQRLALGPLNANNVPVMVAKDKLTISLLGQSYLSRVGTVSISGDRMTLK